MAKIKISFLTDRMILGHGVDIVIDNLARQLQKKGYQISIYCNNFDGTFTGHDHYEIHEIPPFRAKNSFELEKVTKRHQSFFHEIDTDVFIINSFPFYCLAGLLHKPVIAVNYGVIDTTGMPFRRSLFFKYMDFMQNNFYYKKADKVISISRFLHDKLPSKIKRSADPIHLGADHYKKNITAPKRQDFRKSIGVKEQDILLLYVGRLNVTNQPYKGVAELKEIYHRLHEKNGRIKLMMAGYGSKNDEEFLKNEGIIALANVQDPLMPLLYSACDLYATATKWEGFDLPLVEAQSFGKPAICYGIGAHQEVTSPQSAFVVKDAQEFMAKAALLSEDPSLRAQMGNAAASFAAGFTWEKTAQRYNSHLKEMLQISDQDLKISKSAVLAQKKSSTRLSILVINYESSYSCLKACIASIREGTDYEIVLFDNGSKNDSAKRVQNEFKNIRLLQSPVNLGLAKAINEALKQIESTYVLITSFDIVLEKGAIDIMLSMLEKLDKDYIGVAPKTLFYHDKNYIENVGTCIDNSFYITPNGIGQLDMGQYDRPEDIMAASFTCALIKTDAFSPFSVGSLDETFFLFYEEIDFCYRAAIRGYKFKSCPQAVCYHKYAYSFRDDATNYAYKYYYQRLNLLKTAYKNAEEPTLQRITSSEMGIQKGNLSDRNLGPVAKRILSDYKKSLSYLKKQRAAIQVARKASDENVISYSWGERSFFDVVTNHPVYSIENIHDTFLRLYVLSRHVKYLHYVDYIDRLGKVRLRMDPDFLEESLVSLFKHEDEKVIDFIKRM